MTRYEWLASNSGPKGCPMEVIGGDFHLPDGGSVYIPPAGVHTGWGRDVSLHVVGDDKKALPHTLEVLFFSFLEDRFYRGRFALPRDSIERLFKTGFQRVQRPGGWDTYQLLVAGVAPGGAVAVWASGSDRQVEVFFGQAQPADDIDWHRAFDAPDTIDRRQFVAGELKEAAERDPLVPLMMQQLPAGRWAAYRARYRWRPVFEGITTPKRIAPLHFLNGERDYLLLPLDQAAERAGRPVPRYLTFTDRQSGRAYELTFDEEEAAAAFAQAGSGGAPLNVVFAAAGAGLEVSVRSAALTVPLRKTKVEVFDAE